MKTPVAPFFISHHGCPHRCVFCDQEKIAGAITSLPSPGDVLAKIQEFLRTSGSGAVEVAFFGGTFTALARTEQDQLLLPLQPLLASGEVSSVRVSTRPDAIDDESALRLRSLGVKTVELGVQSMDDGVLELSGRGHGARDTERAIACLKDHGCKVGVQLMPGLPGDTFRKSLASLSSVLELAPDFLRIYPAVVIKGTQLAADYANGRYRPLSLQEAVTLCKVMLHESLLAGIPVIRAGLQPTAELERSGVVVAGPFHPAFRQLVEAELYYDLLSLLAGDLAGDNPFMVRCHPSRVSDVIGQGRCNLRRLLDEQGVRIVRVLGDVLLSSREIAVEVGDEVRSGNILTDLNYKHLNCELEDEAHA